MYLNTKKNIKEKQKKKNHKINWENITKIFVNYFSAPVKIFPHNSNVHLISWWELKLLYWTVEVLQN